MTALALHGIVQQGVQLHDVNNKHIVKHNSRTL